MSLLPLDEAQARVLALKSPVEIETVPLIDAAGRWSAAPVVAARAQPAHTLSAMDGYAIRYEERPGPWHVAFETPAGAMPARALSPGEAARIFTGAPLPAGADTVLIQEDATRDGEQLTMTGNGPRGVGLNTRAAGSNFAADAVLIEAGERLTPARLALAAIGGLGSLAVRRRIRVAIVSSGDELVPPGAPVAGAQIHSSNAVMLAAMLAGLPVDVVDHGIVRDDLDALTTAFARAAEDADILVTSGGASVGDHDLVQPALRAAGAQIDFWRIALRPGKPLMAGLLGNTVALGLPGNPVSAFVTAILFLKPLIAHLSGASDPLPPMRTMFLGASIPANGERTDYMRAKSIGGRAVVRSTQDSAALLSLADADLLIVRQPHAAALEAGATVEVLDLA